MFPTIGPFKSGFMPPCAPARPNQYINRRSYRLSALPRSSQPLRYTALRRLTSTLFQRKQPYNIVLFAAETAMLGDPFGPVCSYVTKPLQSKYDTPADLSAPAPVTAEPQHCPLW
jgi:hypothetical protein